MTAKDSSANHKRNRRIRNGIIIGIIIIILLLLKCCSGFNVPETDPQPTPIAQTEEQILLQKMKDDESYLHELYDSPDICSKEWVKEYRTIGQTFQNYEYHGNNQEIHTLLNEYKDYGKKIDEIAISIDKNNYEEGIAQLEELKETAVKNEAELQRLYDEEFK